MNADKQKGPAWPKQGCLRKKENILMEGWDTRNQFKRPNERTQDEGGSSQYGLRGSWGDTMLNSALSPGI